MKQWRLAHKSYCPGRNSGALACSASQCRGACGAVDERSTAGDQFAARRANGLDAERAEFDTLNRQMADAYEVQATELEAAKAAILQIQTDTGHAVAERVRLDGCTTSVPS